MDEMKIGKFSSEFVQKLSKLENLADLTMNNCEIASLDQFPVNLPLIRLELNDNQFEGADLKHLQGLSVGRGNSRSCRRSRS